MTIEYTITHSGRAHRDDLFAAALAVYHHGMHKVFRRDPTEAELNNPDVLVLDVGRRYEPELNNFDHHQLPKEQLECALSLLAKNRKVTLGAWKEKEMTYHDLWKDAPWYRAVILQDCLGPAGMAKHLGYGTAVPEEFASGIEIFCLQEFAANEEVSRNWRDFGVRLITAKVRTAVEFNRQQEILGEIHELRDFDDIGKIFWVPEMTPFGVNKFIARNNLPVCATVTKDPRNNGICLYRHGVGTMIFDFNRIVDEDDVTFAHKGGFVAYVREGTSYERIVELLKMSREDRSFLVTEKPWHGVPRPDIKPPALPKDYKAANFPNRKE